MQSLLLLGVLVLAGEATVLGAMPAHDGPEAMAIDEAVCRDYLRADTWNTAWTATFAVAAVGSAGYALLTPSGWIESEPRAGLWVTAAKATIGTVAKLVAPLRIDVEGLCQDPHPASHEVRQALLAEAARRERNTLFVNIFGGLIVNTAGLLYLGYGRGAWQTAWVSFGIGNAVAAASMLTAPVHSWLLERRLNRSHHLAVVPMLGGQIGSLALAGTW